MKLHQSLLDLRGDSTRVELLVQWTNGQNDLDTMMTVTTFKTNGQMGCKGIPTPNLGMVSKRLTGSAVIPSCGLGQVWIFDLVLAAFGFSI